VFIAKVQALPECISQGATRKEAIANIKDALEGYLRATGWSLAPTVSSSIGGGTESLCFFRLARRGGYDGTL
jgi:hypothetical protein